MTSDLVSLLLDGSENLGVEYKAWMDLTAKEARAELEKDLAATANHGGGFVIFGVDDKSRKPTGRSPYDPMVSARQTTTARAGIAGNVTSRPTGHSRAPG